MSIIRTVEDKGAVARSYARFTQGRVIAVNRLTRTVDLDVQQFDHNGNPVRLYGRPYLPQNPPTIGDMVSVEYPMPSMHGGRVGAARLSSGNGDGSITVVGGAPKDAEYVVLATN